MACFLLFACIFSNPLLRPMRNTLFTSFLLLSALTATGFTYTGIWTNKANNNKVIGASAQELLSATKPSLQIEIQYMGTARLAPATIPQLVTFLQKHLHKPGGILITEKSIAGSATRTLTTQQVALVEKKHRTAYNTSRQVALYILVTDAASAEPDVLGCAYRNTSIVLYGSTLQRFTKGYSITVKSKLETSTLLHETCHLLGLVNLPFVTTAQSNGQQPDGHCNNNKCLMYYKSSGNELAGYVQGSAVPVLDDHCRKALAANGGQ